RRRIALDEPADLVAVRIGQVNVEQDDVGGFFHQGAGLGAGAGLQDVVTIETKDLRQRITADGIVIDGKDRAPGLLLSKGRHGRSLSRYPGEGQVRCDLQKRGLVKAS